MDSAPGGHTVVLPGVPSEEKADCVSAAGRFKRGSCAAELGGGGWITWAAHRGVGKALATAPPAARQGRRRRPADRAGNPVPGRGSRFPAQAGPQLSTWASFEGGRRHSSGAATPSVHVEGCYSRCELDVFRPSSRVMKTHGPGSPLPLPRSQSWGWACVDGRPARAPRRCSAGLSSSLDASGKPSSGFRVLENRLDRKEFSSLKTSFPQEQYRGTVAPVVLAPQVNCFSKPRDKAQTWT